MTLRHQLPALLAKKFIKAHAKMIKEYKYSEQNELTEHLLNTLELIDQFSKTQNKDFWKQYVDLENKLAKKYGKHLKAYQSSYFYKYFQFDIIVGEFDFYSSKEFNALPYEQRDFNQNEISQFLTLCKNALNNELSFLYLQKEPEFIITENKPLVESSADKEATEARMCLAVYYLLKGGLNIQPRNNKNVTEIAHFASMLR